MRGQIGPANRRLLSASITDLPCRDVLRQVFEIAFETV